ncbi:GlxA family transcriptional regulator [Shimia sp. MMG029]|uniref:GlxA family transcriptional regulator n=1 Tax=Shimia sp. MMG029 TaxID=3021978 RepID=UPI0022FED2C4|nr:GlxA family transcriptional regulator [Shimia sp. MMG029]MDA5558997.1 GlxA family transcriptional regulator [Shimia sp. MMG029]
MTHFTFLCLDDFPVSALSMAIDPLRAANEISSEQRLSWNVVSEDGQPVVASSQMSINPDKPLQDIGDTDVVIVFAGASAHFKDRRATAGSLRRLLSHGAKLGAVSGALFALAEEQFFDGYECSAHFCYTAALQEKYDRLILNDTLFTVDRNRLTFAGTSAVFEFMLGVIAQKISEPVAVETACWFQYAGLRDADALQILPTYQKNHTRDGLPASIRTAIELFADNIETKIKIEDVSRKVGMSLRQLERNFKKETGVSPGTYYRKLRLDAARQKLLYTDKTLQEVALSVGYDSTSSFSLNYRREFGQSPTQERKNLSRGSRQAALAVRTPIANNLVFLNQQRAS